MGRFDDAIVQYRKALAIDPNFLNAHQGIAMALLYQGKPDQALAEIGEIGKKARTDGERRTGMFAANVVHIDGGQLGAGARGRPARSTCSARRPTTSARWPSTRT